MGTFIKNVQPSSFLFYTDLSSAKLITATFCKKIISQSKIEVGFIHILLTLMLKLIKIGDNGVLCFWHGWCKNKKYGLF